MKLRPYQERAIDFLYERNAGVLFLEMGAGKTAIMLRTLQELLTVCAVKRVLVVATKRVALSVWKQELEIWAPDLWLAVLAGYPAMARKELIGLPCNNIVVINYENLPWLFENDLHKSFDCIVFDEITKMKNSKSKRFKAYKKHWRQFKVRYAMTGTPTSQGLIDLYAQMHCLDGGEALGRTMTAFRTEYYNKVGVEQWDWKEKRGALDKALDKMHHLAFMIPPAEYQDQLPPLVENVVSVVLPTDVRKLYQEMENESIISWGDHTVVAANAGVRNGMLQQMCDGFLYVNSEGTRPGYIQLHDAKLDALEEIVDSMQGRPLIIVYKYKAELEMMKKRWDAPHIGGGISDKEAANTIDKWCRGELPIMYLQPQSAAHGLNLQSGGNTLVWYGHTWSLEDYDQTNARLRRPGQESDTVVAHQLIVHDSVDEDIISGRGIKGGVLAAVRSGILRRQG